MMVKLSHRCLPGPSHWFGAAVVGAVAQLTAAGAFAADLPPASVYTKAPVAAPYSWTGFYAGLNAGYGWSNDNNVSFINGDPLQYSFALRLGAIPTRLGLNGNGPFGGGQAGYNFQNGAVVYGIEGDLQFAHLSGSASVATAAFGFPNITTSATNKINWFGTLRPRLGFTVAPNFLLYATGGLAYGDVSSSANTVITGPPGISCANNLFCSTGSGSRVNAGWTVGGGAEYALTRSWSVRAEYLYMNLGSVPTYTMQSLPPTGGPGFGMQAATSAFRENLIRAAVNYRF
jgi:outer membrane immunogenic protein